MVQQRKVIEGIEFELYSIHSSATRLIREGTDLSAHAYASEEGRAIDSWRIQGGITLGLGQLQLDMEDDTVNFSGVHKSFGNMASTKIEGFLLRISNMITRRVSSLTGLSLTFSQERCGQKIQGGGAEVLDVLK